MGQRISRLEEDIALDLDLLKGPRELTLDERRILESRVMKKHGVASVTLHWVNAICWLLLLTTGAALFSQEYLRFVPLWYVEMMSDIFGTRAAMLNFHIAVGSFWVVTLLLFGIFGFKNYLMAYIKEDMGFIKEDLKWGPAKVKLLLGKIEEHEMPVQTSYNAGQKAYAVAVAFGTITLMITGPIMAFRLASAEVIQWAILLHYLGTMLVFTGIFIHVYMAGLFPEERPAFFSMITGKVNELYGYMHHFLWWKEIKEKEHAFFREELEKEGKPFPGPETTDGK
jgi:formate dehydrogenase subunit gamma